MFRFNAFVPFVVKPSEEWEESGLVTDTQTPRDHLTFPAVRERLRPVTFRRITSGSGPSPTACDNVTFTQPALAAQTQHINAANGVNKRLILSLTLVSSYHERAISRWPSRRSSADCSLPYIRLSRVLQERHPPHRESSPTAAAWHRGTLASNPAGPASKRRYA